MPTSDAPQPRKLIQEQPDPFLREGTRSRGWTWAVLLVAAGVIIVTVAVLSYRHPNGTALNPLPNQGPPITTGSSSTVPPTVLPTGRTNSNVPSNGQSTTVR
ncbi:MAG TPA: hypothetical protein VHV56_04570 [Pseudolabrys sp.]|nr:hypothetical protein [Pseudolabrys sp.]